MISTMLRTYIRVNKDYEELKKTKIAGMFGWLYYLLYCYNNVFLTKDKKGESPSNTFSFMISYCERKHKGGFLKQYDYLWLASPSSSSYF